MESQCKVREFHLSLRVVCVILSIADFNRRCIREGLDGGSGIHYSLKI